MRRHGSCCTATVPAERTALDSVKFMPRGQGQSEGAKHQYKSSTHCKVSQSLHKSWIGLTAVECPPQTSNSLQISKNFIVYFAVTTRKRDTIPVLVQVLQSNRLTLCDILVNSSLQKSLTINFNYSYVGLLRELRQSNMKCHRSSMYVAKLRTLQYSAAYSY